LNGITSRPLGSGPNAERVAVGGLIAAMAVATASILYLGRDFTFYSDELSWLTYGSDFAPGTVLAPHNGHLIALPRLLYEVLPRLFGPQYLPFRLVALAAFLACVALFFVLARRRVGGTVALLPSVLLLFFGASAVIVLSPLALPFTLSIGFGLAALLAFEDGRDALAAGSLALSVLSHSFGLLLAVGIVTYVLLRQQHRRRLWVPLAPLVGYGVWWMWAQKFDQGIASISNLPDVPAFVIESAVATLAALTGVAGTTVGGRLGDAEIVLEVVLIGAAAVGLALLARDPRGRQGGPWLWSYAVVLLAFWVGLGLTEGPGREPTTPRYLFFGSIMLLLAVAALARGARPGRTAAATLLSLTVISLVLNAWHLSTAAERNAEVADEVRAQLGALEVAGPAANPDFVPAAAAPAASKDIAVRTGAYLDFAREIGGLGLSSSEVAVEPPPIRAGFDVVLARAENLIAVPRATVAGPATRRCERHRPPDGGGPTAFELHPGTHLLRLVADEPPQTLLLRRLAPAGTVPVGQLSAERFAELRTPSDRLPRPWIGEVAAAVEVCRASPGGEG
jgi:hypothetical protein